MSTTRALFIMLGASFFMLAVALALSAAGGQESLAADGIIYVDADATALGNGTSWEDAYTTLQPALDGAVTGDQIWVAVGIYTPTHEFSPGDPRSATFQLKNGVALYGGFDPSVGDVDWEDRDWVNNVTILSGELGDPGNADNSYHVFYHPSASALDSTAVLDGFKITGGNASGGSQHNWGGGMHNRDSSPTVANCTFAGNSATQYGGGMSNQHSSPLVTNCTFTGNLAEDGGAGMYNEVSSPAVTNCTFSSNSATQYGGGMFNFFSCSPAVTNCTFSDNSAYRGGGMYSHVSSPAVTNCTFSGNSAGVDGGGMYNDNSSPQLTNCTFSGNSTSGSGGAIHNWYSSLAVTNSILWGDSPDEISNSSSGSMVTYSDVQGGSDGTGNIDEEPLFVDPGNGDYRLGSDSPCIDTGTNDAPNLPDYDFEGDPRVMDGDEDEESVVDMGVDEAWGILIYVDQDATGDNNGTTWEDAYTSLQPALKEAADGHDIWVAEGTYTPTQESSPGDPRSATFQLKNGVALYGGFDPSMGDVGWADRDWVNNITVLSGDIGAQGDPADNSYHVFYHPGGTDLDSTAILDGFTISGGNADGEYGTDHNSGGGIFNRSSSPTLTNCIFSGNSAFRGGGIANWSSSLPVVTNCTFSGNSVGGLGGGMFNDSSSPAVTNCTFSGNSAFRGGGMCNQHSSSAVTNCTFSGNSAYEGGGMANAFSDSMPVVANCILWGDSPDEIYSWYSQAVITHSDIQGGWDGTGNIDEEPLFVDPGIGDYHLSPGSPCIDTGTNGAPNLPDYDFEGDPRVMDGDADGTADADMGADEVLGLPQDVICVDQDAVGDNNGTCWEDAYTYLQPALDTAQPGDEIWVAEGIYKPTAKHGGTGDRYRSFQLKNGVALYGGFDPTVHDIVWEDRDWVNHETILSGDLWGDDVPPFGNNGENSYHVFYHPAGTDLDGTAVLDGFTITGGNADLYNPVEESPHAHGGGMYNDGSSPELTNCTFASNSAVGGGGVFNRSSAPTLTDCTFSENSTVSTGWPGSGAGMSNLYSSPTLTNCTFSNNDGGSGGGMSNWGSSPELTSCTFSANSADGDGGGMENNDSAPVLTNCIFENNSADGDGGAMFNTNGSPVALTDCTIRGNSASYGGGIYNLEASPALANCIFRGNIADYGGGMGNWGFSLPTLTNCTFSGNSALEGGGIYNKEYSSPTLTNCILWGDAPEAIFNKGAGNSPVVTYSDIQGDYDGIGNIDADPLFLGPGDGDFHLRPDSPCIDAGTNDAPHLPEHDFEGDPRVMDGNSDGTVVVDMGVDEGSWYPVYLPLVFRGY